VRRWSWLFAAIVIAAVVVSLMKQRPPTVGEKVLALMNANHLPTREALLLIDYAPDPQLLASARIGHFSRGVGPASGYGFQPTVTADQQWVQGQDSLLFWRAGDSNTLRASIGDARRQLAPALADVETTASFDAAVADLNRLTDEALFLAWLDADHGVLAEIDDYPAALQQAILLLTRQTPGPVLAFNSGDNHVYVIPEEAAHGAAWCRLEAYDHGGKQLWTGELRVDGSPSTEHVRTMAVVMVEEALKPAPTTQPMPSFMRF
jgi:hypothetical protein